jgi:hypothetical protein
MSSEFYLVDSTSHENLHLTADLIEEIDTYGTDKEDEENFEQLVTFLKTEAEIVPSHAKKYAQMFLDEGFGSTSRLLKKIHKDKNFLEKIGIKEDDIEEITMALNK